MGITRKDWIQLSAYIDGELSRREEDLLKRRIQSDPQLHTALDQLRITKSVLQSTPPISVPRNFTLTPKMVGRKPNRSAAVGYRIATAMMSFLLIGVLVLDFGRFLLGGAMAPAASRMEEVMLESAAKEISEPAHIEVEGEVSQDRMAVEPDDGEPVEEILAEEEAPAIMAEAGVPEETLGFELEAVGEEKSSQDSDLETGANMADEIDEPTTIVQPSPSLTPQPQPTVEYFSPEDNLYSSPWYSRFPVFRVIELLLVLGIVGFGTAAWIKRRR
jgi:hypothetical protein